jgi:hypothetical protein
MTVRIYEPTAAAGPGAGKAFFLIFGYPDREADRDLRSWDLHHLGDDVAALQAAGYRVVACERGDRDLLDAVLLSKHEGNAGCTTVGVLWDGHGDEEGKIETSAGAWFAPEELAPEIATRESLVLFVMTTCCTGKHLDRWQKALGAHVHVHAWGGTVLAERVVDFFRQDPESSTDLDDLLARHLGAHAVMPDAPLADMLTALSSAGPGLRGAVKEASWRVNAWPQVAEERGTHSMNVRVRRNRDPLAHRPLVTVKWDLFKSVTVRTDVPVKRKFRKRDLPKREDITYVRVGDHVMVMGHLWKLPTGKELADMLELVAELADEVRKLVA